MVPDELRWPEMLPTTVGLGDGRRTVVDDPKFGDAERFGDCGASRMCSGGILLMCVLICLYDARSTNVLVVIFYFESIRGYDDFNTLKKTNRLTLGSK